MTVPPILQDCDATGGARFSSPQPNVTGLGLIASYSWRFWGLVAAIGGLSGLSAAALVGLLRITERITYGNDEDTLFAAVLHSEHWRRVAGLAVAALIVVAVTAVLGRRPTGGTEVNEAIWRREGKLDLFGSVIRGALSIVVVGTGASLGREAAPQLYGAAFASRIAELAAVPVWQRRLLVACGAGAGFAAVYNVPLGGALFAVEVMLGSVVLPLVVPALLASATATAVAWLLLGNNVIYHVSTYGFHPSQIPFALLIGPAAGVVAVAWTKLISAANRARPGGRARYLTPLAVLPLLGVVSLEYPQLLGNGRAIVQFGIVGGLGFGLLVVLLVLKPLVTAACVASGAPGGLFTPTFATGTLLAGVGATLWAHLFHGPPVGAYTLIGGAAFLAAAMGGPLSATVLVLELTRHFDTLMVPTLLAVVGAVVVARKLGAQSIYSARLQ